MVFARDAERIAMNITIDEIKKLAEMSRIAVHDDEMVRMQQHVTSVLAYAARVQEIARDVAEQEEIGDSRMRDDHIHVSGKDAAIRAQAPDRQEDLFVVPKIL